MTNLKPTAHQNTRAPLRQKAALIFIAIAAAPVLLLGYSAMRLIDTSHRRDVAALENQLIAQQEVQIKKFFGDKLGVLELQVAFSQNTDVALPDQRFLLSGIMRDDSSFEEVVFLTRGGKETAKLTREGTTTDLVDRSREPYVEQLFQGHNYVGPIHQSLRGSLVTIGAPVRNQQGNVIQALVAEVNLSALTAAIDAARLGSKGYLILADEQGRIIAGGPDATYRGRLIAGAPAVSTLAKGQQLSEEGKRYESFLTGVPVVAAGERLASSQWIVLAE
jgi:hypothetical protein